MGGRSCNGGKIGDVTYPAYLRNDILNAVKNLTIDFRQDSSDTSVLRMTKGETTGGQRCDAPTNIP